MDIFDCIFSRRSVRAFKPDDIDDKFIGLMLDAATHAPSAGNIQDWHFVVIKDETKRKRLASAAFDQDFMADAPVCIVVAADLEKASLRYGKRGENLYAIQDTANVITIIMLAAHELGLGTCWVGAFDEDKVSHVAELPENFRPVAILPVGYPAEKPEMRERVPFEKVTSFNGYGKKFDIAYAVQPEPGKETRIKPIGNIVEDLIKKGKKKMKASKVYSYINSKGQVYWLHSKEGKGGTTLFFFSRRPKDAIYLPEGMEVFESESTHLPMLRKKK